ncbi:hypothetical protein [Amycolatopsis sp. DG1A-15b]|uniref:hypothetical protein n=1 Tax=Amycolatopsis sp. DG1A-15b TaxID=3052846 RepID=UPI00255BA9DE|nr:hypothetical protein [Amycolatopsis sp. DG1A-15b]WIX88613.1 hypothetical protein QRY02_47150 [Amycolatopsis sp. DG1A-15b]
MLSDERWTEHTRATNPGAIRQAYATRKRRPRLLSDNGTLFLVAADAPLGRRTLPERLLVAMSTVPPTGSAAVLLRHGAVKGLVVGRTQLGGNARAAAEAAAKTLEAAK